MLIKAKYRADGSFEKVKARLVSRGNHQDATLYEQKERTAPAVSLTAVLAAAAVAAGEKAEKTNFDITSAFTEAKMKKPVYMKLSRNVTEIYVKMYPDLLEFVDEKGEMTVLLLRAMYGCLEAAQLWYELMEKLLSSFGFQNSETEPCLWMKGGEEAWIQVLLYMDDGLVFTNSATLMSDFKKSMRSRFGDGVKFADGDVINYVEMLLDFSAPGVCRVSILTPKARSIM